MAQAVVTGISPRRLGFDPRPVHGGFVVEWDRLFSEYFSVCDSFIPPMSLLIDSSTFFHQNRNLI